MWPDRIGLNIYFTIPDWTFGPPRNKTKTRTPLTVDGKKILRFKNPLSDNPDDPDTWILATPTSYVDRSTGEVHDNWRITCPTGVNGYRLLHETVPALRPLATDRQGKDNFIDPHAMRKPRDLWRYALGDVLRQAVTQIHFPAILATLQRHDPGFLTRYTYQPRWNVALSSIELSRDKLVPTRPDLFNPLLHHLGAALGPHAVDVEHLKVTSQQTRCQVVQYLKLPHMGEPDSEESATHEYVPGIEPADPAKSPS